MSVATHCRIVGPCVFISERTVMRWGGNHDSISREIAIAVAGPNTVILCNMIVQNSLHHGIQLR